MNVFINSKSMVFNGFFFKCILNQRQIISPVSSDTNCTTWFGYFIGAREFWPRRVTAQYNIILHTASKYLSCFSAETQHG